MTKRKFYKTIIKVEVLSEEPFVFDNLKDIDYAIVGGSCSGVVSAIQHKTLNGKQIAKELFNQGSEPDFFSIDKNGNDIQ